MTQNGRTNADDFVLMTRDDEGNFSRRHRRRAMRLKAQKTDNVLLPRQGSEFDPDSFSKAYDSYDLLQPRYSFSDLYDIVEESDVLSTCIAAMVDDVDGHGHDFSFLGDDKTERDSPDFQRQLRMLRDFFDFVNERGSLVNVRKALRRDLESVGNAALELQRNGDGDIEKIYHIPITYLRMTGLDEQPTSHAVRLPRNGKIIEVNHKKRFRRYARKLPNTETIRWFKEFGDPRSLDAITGKYAEEQNGRITESATELWWFSIPFRNFDYGAPRWIGCVGVIKARILAHFVNYDLFNNQGIPPLLIVVEDGQLTDASLDEIEDTIESWRDPEKFNRVCVIQAAPSMLGIEETKGKSSVQIHFLRDARAEDYMFKDFLAYSESAIRKCFRLPPLHLGATEEYNLATSYASRITAEQQVFSPLRREFDELINIVLVLNNFGIEKWRFKSKGPQIAGSEEISKIAGTAARSGGPSMNQLIELWNEALGTDWSTRDDAVYKVPAAIALRLTQQGRIGIDEHGNLMSFDPSITNESPSLKKAQGPVSAEKMNVLQLIREIEGECRQASEGCRDDETNL